MADISRNEIDGESPEGDLHVTLGWDDENLWAYASSFAWGAHSLYDALREPGLGTPDAFVWLYCWRHAFELILKALVFPDVDFCEREKHLHGLSRLLKLAQKHHPNVHKQEAIAKAVQFLDEVDPDGMALRYPKSKKDERLLSNIWINVPEKQKELSTAYDFISGMCLSLKRGPQDGVFMPSKRVVGSAHDKGKRHGVSL